MLTPGVRDKSLSVRTRYRQLLALIGATALIWVLCSWLIANYDHENRVAAVLREEVMASDNVPVNLVGRCLCIF